MVCMEDRFSINGKLGLEIRVTVHIFDQVIKKYLASVILCLLVRSI